MLLLTDKISFLGQPNATSAQKNLLLSSKKYNFQIVLVVLLGK